ncbi:hypothetical protein [Desulfocastanea catecholica]
MAIQKQQATTIEKMYGFSRISPNPVLCSDNGTRSLQSMRFAHKNHQSTSFVEVRV